jgi:hypothetical protein
MAVAAARRSDALTSGPTTAAQTIAMLPCTGYQVSLLAEHRCPR